MPSGEEMVIMLAVAGVGYGVYMAAHAIAHAYHAVFHHHHK